MTAIRDEALGCALLGATHNRHGAGFFSALTIPPVRRGLIALALARSCVIVGRFELFNHGRPVACRALIA